MLCEGAKSVEGEAQIVMARGKKRFIYDFNVTLDIEIIVEAGIPDSTGDDSAKGAYIRDFSAVEVDNSFSSVILINLLIDLLYLLLISPSNY